MSVVDPPPVPAPRRNSAKTIAIAAVVLVITFLSGAAAGMLFAHLGFMHRGPRMHSPRMVPKMMVHRLSRSLDLTPEQRTKVEAIVKRYHARIFRVTESVHPQVRAEIEAANREIEALLTPEQREKFQKLKLRLGHHEGRSRRGPTR